VRFSKNVFQYVDFVIHFVIQRINKNANLRRKQFTFYIENTAEKVFPSLDSHIHSRMVVMIVMVVSTYSNFPTSL